MTRLRQALAGTEASMPLMQPLAMVYVAMMAVPVAQASAGQRLTIASAAVFCRSATAHRGIWQDCLSPPIQARI